MFASILAIPLFFPLFLDI